MKKALFMACALVAGFALTSCDSDRLTPTGDTTKLWIAGEDDSNLLGYINGSGKMVIPANYQTAYNFSCGWALVKEDGEYMYIDANGKAAKNMPEADTYYNYFYYNLVTFKIDGLLGKWNNNFKEVVPAEYKSLGMNTDAGLMWFSEDGKEYGFLNEQGKQVIEPQFSFCSSFEDGICVVGVNKTVDSQTERRYGVIDTDGRTASAVDYGVVETKAGAPFPERLQRLYEQLSQGLYKNDPGQGRIFIPRGMRGAVR